MKTLKIFHLLFVMLWTVGVVAMTVLCLLKPLSGDELYMLLRITRFIDDAIVIPGAILTVLTALVYGIFTGWGFFKHTWVTVKWIASILIIIIGTFCFSPILDSSLALADAGRDSVLSSAEITGNIRVSFIGGVCQGSALITLIVISVLKPWKNKKGRTV